MNLKDIRCNGGSQEILEEILNWYSLYKSGLFENGLLLHSEFAKGWLIFSPACLETKLYFHLDPKVGLF